MTKKESGQVKERSTKRESVISHERKQEINCKREREIKWK